jgi:hypothetical protein
MRAISSAPRRFTASSSALNRLFIRSVLLVFQAGATEDDVVDPRGKIPGHDGVGRLHLALSIAKEDLDAWRQRLLERAIDIVGEYRWPRGGVSLYIRDPDGALLELATPGLWW